MRVTENLLVHGFLRHTGNALANMTRAQELISSGKKIQRPSDDPLVFGKALGLHSDLRRVEAWQDNVSSATAFMSMTESSLQEVSDMLSRAKELLVEAANAPSEGIAEPAHATELRSMIEGLMLVANRDIAGRYLFGGRETQRSPYAQLGGEVVYQGDTRDLLEQLGPGLRVAMNLSGPQAFQTVPSEIGGTVDLDPSISTITPLSELFQGNGATPGPIRLTDSNGVSADVDLSGATTVGQVIDGINNAGTGIVASLGADGQTIELTDTAGGSSFEVLDIQGGTLASRLGLAGDATGPTRTSFDLDPAVTEETPAALLLNGAGIPPGAWTLRNAGEEKTWEGTIDPSSANTVKDLIDLVAGAETPEGENLGLRAEIENGRLVIRSIRKQTTVSVTDEPGGNSAATLGVAGVGEARDVFALLEDAARAIERNDHDAIDSMIRSFTYAIEETAGLRGSYGARSRQVLRVGENLENQSLDLTIRLSDVEDADLAKAAVELAKSEAVYNASLATGTQLLRLSLFNYIR
jgi:flagellar hook-associated protein 3 FlgL